VEASELSILKTGDVEDSVLPKIIVPSAHSVPDETETRYFPIVLINIWTRGRFLSKT
jgi:hypothetical protein